MQPILISFFDDLGDDVELRIVTVEQLHLFAASDVLQGLYRLYGKTRMSDSPLLCYSLVLLVSEVNGISAS